MSTNTEAPPAEPSMASYRLDRRRDRATVVVPLLAAVALTVAFLYTAFVAEGGNAATLAAPTGGAGADRPFWLGAGMTAALLTAAVNWRIAEHRRLSSSVGALFVVVSVALAVAA